MEKQKLEAIIEQIDRAEALSDENDFGEARDALLAVDAECARERLESGFLNWRLCVVFDILEEHELAFKYVQQALRMDPLAPPFRNSFGVVVKRIQKAILEAEPGEEDFVSRYYELLVNAGEGNDAVHIAMARDLNARGEHERALGLMNALTVLSPGCRDAWLARAAICRSLGDHEAAREADVEAAALTEGPKVPFAVSGSAEA